MILQVSLKMRLSDWLTDWEKERLSNAQANLYSKQSTIKILGNLDKLALLSWALLRSHVTRLSKKRFSLLSRWWQEA
jgi:hypothetical protein